MFSLRSNGLPCGRFLAPLVTNQPSKVCQHIMRSDNVKRRSTGGRPKGDPALRRNETIGVRVSASEYAALRTKAAMMHMPPANGCVRLR